MAVVADVVNVAARWMPVFNATDVAVAAPMFGVTRVGLVAKTKLPEPVSSVTADAKFAEEGVAKNVATPVPSPLTPVAIGKPVQLVNVPDVGVPRTGVTSVGLVAKTSAPDPVSSVTAAAKFADDGVARNVATPVARPLTPVEIGSPEQFVSVPLDGVPSAPPFTTTAPALPIAVPKAVATPVPSPLTPVEIGNPVQLVRVPLDGVPNAGVTRVGLVAKTIEPVPVVPLLKFAADICVPAISYTFPAAMLIFSELVHDAFVLS